MAFGVLNVYIHSFLTSALVGSEWSALRPGRFALGTHWIRDWVEPNDVEKRIFLTLSGLELRLLCRPSRSQLLYLLYAIAQAVNSWIPITAAWVRVRSACGVCGGQSGTGAGFFRVLRFPLPITIPPVSPPS
jgi:hypothetical protein